MHLPTRTLRRAVRAWDRRRTARRCSRLPAGAFLHVGCGNTRLPGWINIDKFRTPAVDYVVDIRYGLPFQGLMYIYAEHFLEHLSYEEATQFLAHCRQALGTDGVLRLSTPNLDWVYATQYHLDGWESPAAAVRDCFWMNKAFRGWGHQFLYNSATLTAVLQHAGFQSVTAHEYGESNHEPLRNLERHERMHDDRQRPHVLIVEATGIGTDAASVLAAPTADYLAAVRAR